ncbi:MAG: 30S ribosomal protein S4 [Pseudomonadota bacterium]|nr:30S ribosomal protein S4 [Pseudomonadota bacterium]
MTKRLNAKYKLDRRLGENIWGRPKSPVNKREYGPGQHGQRRKSKISDFGTQLRAKQKLKGYYANITERQFSKYYEEASRMTGNTSENLIGLLERRIDAVVYRAKFAMTMFAARQLVSHGHVKVNGRRVTIASIEIKVGDTVELSDKAKDFPVVGEALATSERDTPDYVETNGKDNAKLTRIPSLGDVPYPVQMQPALVVEYYSR